MMIIGILANILRISFSKVHSVLIPSLSTSGTLYRTQAASAQELAAMAHCYALMQMSTIERTSTRSRHGGTL